ncbi:putative plasmid stabilization protein (plasmid) [Mycetohabitans rhizoxinica HKI 454]|uniref:Putative plasmid stabilization protein n=1 Tax=Mycetohabitans rhizoxinica (strain DSM 19002 / CIP 109453 / HKI 454) TaxID=882378 RepID=E5AW53_MYCRK|nr:putative plasmid stabilization protein [Mycetohabitans rhizoxinica HKI 454]
MFKHGPGLAAVACRRGAARVAAGRERSVAAGQRRIVRRATGKAARRTGATAGYVRRGHGERGDAARHTAILEAVDQFAPAHVTRLSKLKKSNMASEAERLAEGIIWLPAMFRAARLTGCGGRNRCTGSRSRRGKGPRAGRVKVQHCAGAGAQRSCAQYSNRCPLA